MNKKLSLVLALALLLSAVVTASAEGALPTTWDLTSIYGSVDEWQADYDTVMEMLDNYEQYTDEEKDQIKAIFQQVADLNSVLDKYDVKSKFDLQEYLTALGRCFEAFHY